MLPIAYRLLPNLPIAECMLPVACCLLTAKVIHFPAPISFLVTRNTFCGQQNSLLGPGPPVTPKSLATKIFGSPKILHVASLIQVWAPQNYP